MSSSSPAVSWARMAASAAPTRHARAVPQDERADREGRHPRCREIQYKADRIIYKMCEAHGNLYAVMKEILRRMYGLELGGVRAPLPGLIPEDEPSWPRRRR